MFQQWNAQKVPTLDTWLSTLLIHPFLVILVFFLALCPSVSTKSKSSHAQPLGIYQLFLGSVNYFVLPLDIFVCFRNSHGILEKKCRFILETRIIWVTKKKFYSEDCRAW